MKYIENDYLFSDEKALLSVERICSLLSQSYWAKTRPRETMELAINNSMCFGIYHNNYQIGFARIISDFATMYYLCDFIIDEGYRGRGLGKKLINLIVNAEEFKGFRGLLLTKDAHGLYEKFGFVQDGSRFMYR